MLPCCLRLGEREPRMVEKGVMVVVGSMPRTLRSSANADLIDCIGDSRRLRRCGSLSRLECQASMMMK